MKHHSNSTRRDARARNSSCPACGREGAGNKGISRYRDPLRSGRLPRTLIDGSTGGSASAGIRALAAAMHFRRPCYAAQLQRMGRALAEGVTEAGAMAAWTETPVPLGDVADNTLVEASLTDTAAAENTLTERDWTTLGGPIV